MKTSRQARPPLERPSRSVRGLLLGLSFLVSTLLPGAMVLAEPQIFTRVGPGVSGSSVASLSFASPKFGDISDAINVASGNVYVDLGSLSHNNTARPMADAAPTSTPANSGSLSGGYSVTGVMKLNGFNKTRNTAQSEWALSIGDGSAQMFRRASDAEIDAAPSWINQRYAAIRGGTAYYISKPQSGVQTDETWIVYYQRADGTFVAHYYDHHGQRTTFWGDGEYADFEQTPAEQYRSAKYMSDADGVSASSPKTEFTYTTAGNGHLQKVKDSWGRVSMYEWDESRGVLLGVSLLMSDETVWSSFARRTEFAYTSFNNQWVVSGISFRTFDGHGNPVNRYFSLDYTFANGETLLKSVNRPVLGHDQNSGIGLKTIYKYNDKNQVILASTQGEPDTSFSYGQSSSDTGAGGPRVTQTQGDKITVYEYSPEGWLRNLSVRDYNSVTGSDLNPTDAIWKGRNTMRWFDASGRITAMSLPNGSQVQNIYDGHGNLAQTSTYATPVNWANPAPSGYVNTTQYSYDNDNQNTAEITPSISGSNGRTYEGVENTSIYTYLPTLTLNNLGFQMITSIKHTVSSGSSTYNSRICRIQLLLGRTCAPGTQNIRTAGVEKYSQSETYDEYGRLTDSSRDGSELAGRLTHYVYFSPGAQGNAFLTTTPFKTMYDSLPAVKLYADQVYSQTVGGVLTQFGYDQYGNLNLLRTYKSHVYGWSSGSRLEGETQHAWAYNGFGQPVWETVWEHQNAKGEDRWPQMLVKSWSYYSSGELDSTWDGSPNNVTDERYVDDPSSNDYGRLVAVVSGVGAQGGVTTSHKTTTIAYDYYARVRNTTTDGFKTETTYDTLDRPIKVTKADGSVVTTSYDASGQVTSTTVNDRNSNATALAPTTTTAHDSLGRPYIVTYPDGSTVLTDFDPYGRPVKITDNRLTVNDTSEDRSTYLVYDALGHLLKKLGPALISTAGQKYTDTRRPYEEYSYDNFGRNIAVQKLLFGKSVQPTDLTTFNLSTAVQGVAVATTLTSYDIFDRPVTITDPGSYTTTLSYDNDGNAIQKTQQVWNGSEKDANKVRDGATAAQSVTTYAAFDGAGRPLQKIDARGNSRSATYDVFGNVMTQTDERGVVMTSKLYTPDGLLEYVFAPRLNNGTVETSSLMELYTYKDRIYPDQIKRAWNQNGADGNLSITKYTYDEAGHPTSIVLPAANTNNQTTTLTKDYNGQGQVLSEKDANGFTTTYTYDALGRMIKKDELARDGSATDSNAGLGSGLHSSYSYDSAGNLTQKNEHGLVTSYQYNSLGKVIAESRPHTLAVGDEYWKLNTYRLDGLKTAQTTYDYNGNLAQTPYIVWGQDTGNTVGNITIMAYNNRGDQTAELSYPNGSTLDSVWYQYTNGLGQRYKREFSGSAAIYAAQRTNDGTLTGNSNYLTYWKSDPNGNLLESWDTPALDGWGWGALGAYNADKQNHYTYTYSASNKEISQSRDVQVSVKNTDPSNTLYNQGGSNGVLLADSDSNTNTTYNERDLIASVATSENLPGFGPLAAKHSSTGSYNYQNTSYRYYLDGRLEHTALRSGKYRDVIYDSRGRETTVTTQKGVTTTNYDPSGSRYSRVVAGGNEVFSSNSTPTVAGLPAIVSSSGLPNSTAQSNVYNSMGLVTTTTSGATVSTNNYNNYGQLSYVNNVTSDSNGSNATTYTYGYNSAGNIFNESKPDPVSGYVTIYNYTLDSKGKRLQVSGGSYDGGVKRYNAEDQVAQFYIYSATFMDEHTGFSNRYDDFRYDPYGQQALSSVGMVAEGTQYNEYNVVRDINSTVLVGGQVQYVFRKAGRYLHQYIIFNGSYTDYDLAQYPDSNTYGANDFIMKDNSYSLADGYNDSTAWTGVVRFALPKRKVAGLQAPVTPLSNKLRINPQDVKNGNGLPRVADPAKVAQGAADKAGETANASTVKGITGAVSVTITPPTSVVGSSLVPVGSVQPIQSSPVGSSAISNVGTQGLANVTPVQAAPVLPLKNPLAVTNGSAAAGAAGAVKATPPAGSGAGGPQAKSSQGTAVFAQEVADDFNDHSGFKYAVYALNVRALDFNTTTDQDPEDIGAVNFSLQANQGTSMGALTPTDAVGANDARHDSQTSQAVEGGGTGFGVHLGKVIAGSDNISDQGKSFLLGNLGYTYVPGTEIPGLSPDEDGIAVPTVPQLVVGYPSTNGVPNWVLNLQRSRVGVSNLDKEMMVIVGKGDFGVGKNTDVDGLYHDFYYETGRTVQYYGPNNKLTMALMSIAAVGQAIDSLYSGDIAARGPFSVDFGLPGFLSATADSLRIQQYNTGVSIPITVFSPKDKGLLEHFLGSYQINVKDLGDRIGIIIENATGMESATRLRGNGFSIETIYSGTVDAINKSDYMSDNPAMQFLNLSRPDVLYKAMDAMYIQMTWPIKDAWPKSILDNEPRSSPGCCGTTYQSFYWTVPKGRY